MKLVLAHRRRKGIQIFEVNCYTLHVFSTCDNFLFRPLAIRTAHDCSHSHIDAVLVDESWLTYSQRSAQMWSTKTGQYRRMRQEWRHNVVLGRSRIQGLGLFVKKEIEEVS